MRMAYIKYDQAKPSCTKILYMIILCTFDGTKNEYKN